MSESITPRLAESTADLRAGSTVAWLDATTEKWAIGTVIDPELWADEIATKTLVILHEPPEPPVEVPRREFDRLVEMLNWNPRYEGQIEDAASDLVDSVIGTDWDWRRGDEKAYEKVERGNRP